jgi:hypothetical protein
LTLMHMIGFSVDQAIAQLVEELYYYKPESSGWQLCRHVSEFPRKWGILDALQPYGPQRPATGITWSVLCGVLHSCLRVLQGALLPVWAFSHWPAVAPAVFLHGTQPSSCRWDRFSCLTLPHSGNIYRVHEAHC